MNGLMLKLPCGVIGIEFELKIFEKRLTILYNYVTLTTQGLNVRYMCNWLHTV